MYIKGHQMAVAIGTTTQNLAVVGASRGCTLSIEREMIEKAPEDAGCKSFMAGMEEWGISTDGLYAISGAIDLAQKLVAGTELYVMMYADTRVMEGTSLKYVREKYSGKALLQNLQLSGSIDGIGTYAAQLKGTGKLYVTSTKSATEETTLNGTFTDSGSAGGGGISGAVDKGTGLNGSI